MNEQQQRRWRAIQAGLRRGQPLQAALFACRDAGIPVVAVVRHHLGHPGTPTFNTGEDVSDRYGLAALPRSEPPTETAPETKGDPTP